MLGFRLAEEGTQTLLVGAAKRSGFVDITATMDNGILGTSAYIFPVWPVHFSSAS